MSTIKVEHHPDKGRLAELGVLKWPVWTREISEFPWSYDRTETCYFLEGQVEVTPDGGQAVPMGQGDLAIFPAGMSCRWKIVQPVKKHYSFA